MASSPSSAHIRIIHFGLTVRFPCLMRDIWASLAPIALAKLAYPPTKIAALSISAFRIYVSLPFRDHTLPSRQVPCFGLCQTVTEFANDCFLVFQVPSADQSGHAAGPSKWSAVFAGCVPVRRFFQYVLRGYGWRLGALGAAATVALLARFLP